jgi:hypothetical protein
VGTTPKNCDDGNPCTGESCDAEKGCLATPLEGECDDGNACTTEDHCDQGICGGKALTCDDSNPCTDDSCDQLSGCLFTDNTGACDDGDPCTTGDACIAGACVNDEDQCECHEDGDCVAGLDDKCMASAICNQEVFPYVCEPAGPIACEQPDSGCSLAQCNPATGECELSPQNDGEPCVDPDQCVPEGTCEAGLCVGAPPDCDDGNPCTTDACVAGEGCTNEPGVAPCDDADPCTINDFCTPDGTCAGQDVGCGVIPALQFKLTTLVFEKPGFCLPAPAGECLDATALVNSFVESDLNDPTNPLVMVGEFDPFDLEGETSLFHIGPADCDYDADGNVKACQFTGNPADLAPVVFAQTGQCETESGLTSPAPCFAIAGEGLEIGLMDIVVPVVEASVSGTFIDMPWPTGIANGHISAFLEKKTAEAIKVSLPLMPAYKLTELLNPADLTANAQGVQGWILLIHYTGASVAK